MNTRNSWPTPQFNHSHITVHTRAILSVVLSKMLSWENVAPNKRLILSKRICPAGLNSPSQCSSSWTTRPCSPDQKDIPPLHISRRSKLKRIPPDKTNKTNAANQLKYSKPLMQKEGVQVENKSSKSTSFDSTLGNSIISRNIERCPGSRKYSDSCSEYSNNLNNSESSSGVKSIDMRTPEDLAEFSLETSGKSFTSLNELNRNPRLINEEFDMKIKYIDSQPLSSHKLLKSGTKAASPNLIYSHVNQNTTQVNLGTYRKYLPSAEKKGFPRKKYADTGKDRHIQF